MKKKKSQTGQSEEVGLLKAQLVRTMADYDNLVKRTARDRENLTKLAGIGILSRVISVLDILDQAQIHLKDSGLSFAISEVVRLLKDNDIEEIKVNKGDLFDENSHEAVDGVEGKDDEIGKIAEIVLKGWKYTDGQILRHTKVKVYKKD